MIVLPDLPAVIKKLATDAVEGSKPAAVQIGTVLSPSPLKIQIDQKLILTEEFFLLTKAVVDYTINMSVNHTTTVNGEHSHSHGYVGTKAFTIHNGLQTGDKVILLRVQGGQQFVVLDKVGGGNL